MAKDDELVEIALNAQRDCPRTVFILVHNGVIRWFGPSCDQRPMSREEAREIAEWAYAPELSDVEKIARTVYRFLGSSDTEDGLYGMMQSKEGTYLLGANDFRFYLTYYPQLIGLPGFLELFGYCLSGKSRAEVFTPAYNDLVADYVRTRAARYQGPIARRWLAFCFASRTLWLVLQCLRVSVFAALTATLFFFIPADVKQWAWEWWCRHWSN